MLGNFPRNEICKITKIEENKYISVSPDRRLQARNSNPPVTLCPVTVETVNTVSCRCYSIQLQMAASDLANYITGILGSYSCPCAHYGDIEVAWVYSSTHSESWH